MQRVKFNPEVNVGHVLIVLSMIGGALFQGIVGYGKYKDLQFQDQRMMDMFEEHAERDADHFQKLDLAISKLSDVSARLQTEQARQAETIRLIYPNRPNN